jgi:hypothetical protein
MICSAYQILFGDKIKGNELGVACSTYGVEEISIEGVGDET